MTALRVSVVAVIIITVILKYEELTNLDVRALIEKTNNLEEAGALIVGIYALKSIVFVIPASMLYMSVGIAFDFLPGLLINALGIFAEINITYFLGKFLGGEKVEKKLDGTKYGAKIIELRDKKTPYIFLVRLLPVFPIDFVSLFLGASGMKYLPYLLVSFFGILPRIAIFTFFGDTLYQYIPKNLMMILIAVVIVGVMIAGIIKGVKTKKDD